MILVAIGSNLPAGPAETPFETAAAGVDALGAAGLDVVAASRWYLTEPQPPSGQPDFVNGVVRLDTRIGPAMLLGLLHGIEQQFGRARTVANAARTLDLDLIDYQGRVQGSGPVLPHPRAHLRNFVLLPLAEIAPDWCHPVSRRPVGELIAHLPAQGPATPTEA